MALRRRWKQTGSGCEWDTQDVAHAFMGQSAQGRHAPPPNRRQAPPLRQATVTHTHSLLHIVRERDQPKQCGGRQRLLGGSFQPLSPHTPTLFHYHTLSEKVTSPNNAAGGSASSAASNALRTSSMNSIPPPGPAALRSTRAMYTGAGPEKP